MWYIVGDLNDSPMTWIRYYNVHDMPSFNKYIYSFYWTTSTVVTVGYGDVHAQNTIERIMSILMMFGGVIFYSFTIGSLSSILNEYDTKESVLSNKLEILAEIKSKYKLEDKLYARIRKAITYGVKRSDDDTINFLNELPLSLKIEMSYKMYKDFVLAIDFFKNKPKRLIALIAPYLKPMRVGANEYITCNGDYANEVYFIKTGQVNLVLKDYNNFKYLSISKGYYFGEMDVLFGETRKYTYLADCDVEMLTLHKKHFTRIFFHEFREIGSEIYKNALKRRIRVNEAHKDAEEYCKKKKIKKEKRRSSNNSTKHFNKMTTMNFASRKSILKSSNCLNEGAFNIKEDNKPLNSSYSSETDDESKMEDKNELNSNFSKDEKISDYNDEKGNVSSPLHKNFAFHSPLSNILQNMTPKKDQDKITLKIKNEKINQKIERMENNFDKLYKLFKDIGNDTGMKVNVDELEDIKSKKKIFNELKSPLLRK